MEVEIYAHVLEPSGESDGYMVIVSGAPSDPRHTLPPMVRYGRYASRWKAEAGRDELAQELRHELAASGHRVIGVHRG